MEEGHNDLFIKSLTNAAKKYVSNADPIRENVALIVDQMSITLHRCTRHKGISGAEVISGYSQERKEQMENALDFELFHTFINVDTRHASFKRNGVRMFPDIPLNPDDRRNEAKQMQIAIIVVESITLVLHLIGVSIREVNDDDMKRVFVKVRDRVAWEKTLRDEVEQIMNRERKKEFEHIQRAMIEHMFILVCNAYESEFLLDILKTLFPLRIYSYVPTIIARITAFTGILAAKTDAVTKFAWVVRENLCKEDGQRFVKHLIALEKINNFEEKV